MRWLIAVGAIVLVGCGGTSKTDSMGDLAGVDGISGDKVGVSITFVGKGTVANGGTTACDGTSSPCSFTVAANSNLTLTATAGEGHTFTSWQCNLQPATTAAALTISSGTGLQCTVTFTKQSYSLTINVTPSGGGTVLGTPGSLQCGVGGTVCQTMQEYGTVVALSLIKAQFHTFTGWSGDCAGTSENLNVTITKNMTCTATLTSVTFPLSMSVLGPNGDAGPFGALQTAPDVGTCNAASCAAVNVAGGTALTITAVPATNYQVGDWGGDCIGTGSSATINSIVMNAAKSCSVRFVKQKRLLTVNVGGGGKVTGDKGGLESPNVAPFVEYDHGEVVLLTAAPVAVGAAFQSWSGDCASFGSSLTGSITMNAAKSCTATFTTVPVTLTVTSTPGQGTVSSDSGGITACSTSCNSTGLFAGAVATLTATEASGYVFDKWTGDCTGTSKMTVITLNGDKTCNATFLPLYTLTAAVTTQGAGTGGTVAVSGSAGCTTSGCSIPKNGIGSVIADANPGYRVKSITCTGSSATTTTIDTTTDVATASIAAMTANTTCTATFLQRVLVTGDTSVGTTTVTPSAGVTVDLDGTPDNLSETGSIMFSTSVGRIGSMTGAFSTGTGTATGCVQTPSTAVTSLTTNIKVSAANTAGASYKCTANVVNRITITTSVAGATGSVTMAPVGSFSSCTGNVCTVDSGSANQATLTAPALGGVTFTGWTGDATFCNGTPAARGSISNVKTIASATSNVTCTANYATVPGAFTFSGASHNIADPVGPRVGATCAALSAGWTAAANGGEYWCLVAPLNSTNPTTPAGDTWATRDAADAYVKCSTLTSHLITPTASRPQGDYRVSVRWRKDSYQSAILSQKDFYLHNSLDCAVPCGNGATTTAAASVLDYKGRSVANYVTAANTTSASSTTDFQFNFTEYTFNNTATRKHKALGTGEVAFVTTNMKLRNPAVHVDFANLHNESRRGHAALASASIDRNSLRHKWVLSADNKLLMVVRQYASIDDGSCTTVHHAGINGYNFIGTNFSEQRVHCDAMLLNSRGEGICYTNSPGIVRRKSGLGYWIKVDWNSHGVVVPQ